MQPPAPSLSMAACCSPTFCLMQRKVTACQLQGNRQPLKLFQGKACHAQLSWSPLHDSVRPCMHTWVAHAVQRL